MSKYFTKTDSSYVPNNKLAEALQEYLKTKNRLILVSRQACDRFRHEIMEDIIRIHEQHPRCKPIRHHWSNEKSYTGKDDRILFFDGQVPNLVIYEAKN